MYACGTFLYSPARPLPHILPARRNLELKAFECLEGSQKASSLPAHNELVQDRDSLEHIPFLNFRSSITVSSEPQTLQLVRLETDASRLSRSISRTLSSHTENQNYKLHGWVHRLGMMAELVLVSSQ